jgi:WD40 repeat protein
MALAPDGSWLAAGYSVGVVRIWDPDNCQILHTLSTPRTPGSTATAMAAAPHGHWLAAGCSDGTVRLWAADSAQLLQTFSTPDGRITALAVSPDSRLIACLSDITLRVWDTAEEKMIALMRTDSTVSSCAWANDGRTLFVGGESGLFSYVLG